MQESHHEEPDAIGGGHLMHWPASITSYDIVDRLNRQRGTKSMLTCYRGRIGSGLGRINRMRRMRLVISHQRKNIHD